MHTFHTTQSQNYRIYRSFLCEEEGVHVDGVVGAVIGAQVFGGNVERAGRLPTVLVQAFQQEQKAARHEKLIIALSTVPKE
jgi:hypothetical protein